MVCARLNLRFQLSTQKQKAIMPKRLNVSKLIDPSISDQLQESIRENLSSTTPENFSLKQRWVYHRDTIYNSAKDTIGFQKRNHRDWFDENNPTISNLLNQKQAAFQAVLSNDTRESRARYSQARSTCQRELRHLQIQWWLDRTKDKEIEQHAERQDSRAFFQSVKFAYQRRQIGISPINDSQGNRLSEKEDILAR